jgi:hypothetical protein
MASLPPVPAYVPWFNRHPRLALAGIALMFALVTAWRVALGDDTSVAVTVLYVVPISLAALAWGRVAGLSAAGVALTLLVLWLLLDDVELTALGWATRVVPLVLAGLLLGDTSDRLRRAQRAHEEQLERELLHRQAVEVNDSLVQGMAAAKWAIEAGNHDLGLRTLEETIEAGQRMVSQLIRESGMGPVTSDPRQAPR